MRIEVKKLSEEAVIPTRANSGDAGLDLTATSMTFTEDYIEYGTGLAFEIPEGYVGLIFARSSISKMAHSVANAVGVIDACYRGEVKIRMRYKKDRALEWYKVGDRVAQLVVMPCWPGNLVEVNELSKTDRGSGGFGSSGN